MDQDPKSFADTQEINQVQEQDTEEILRTQFQINLAYLSNLDYGMNTQDTAPMYFTGSKDAISYVRDVAIEMQVVASICSRVYDKKRMGLSFTYLEILEDHHKIIRNFFLGSDFLKQVSENEALQGKLVDYYKSHLELFNGVFDMLKDDHTQMKAQNLVCQKVVLEKAQYLKVAKKSVLFLLSAFKN